MSDKVRPQDLAKYLKEYVLPRWKEESAKSLQIYEQKKQEYESKWWSKLFGYKFDDSFYGSNNDSYWSHLEYKNLLKRTEMIADKITYHIETNQEFMAFPDNMSIYTFYTWCAQNNIPY